MNTDSTDTKQHEGPSIYQPAGGPPVRDPHVRRRRWWPWVLIVAAVAFGAYLLIPGSSRGQAKTADGKDGKGAKAPAPPVPVVVATAKVGDIPVYLTGLGNVTALNTATVKSRVDGQLLRIDFREGQLVHQGDLLAELDPRPFQVQLMQAQGQKGRDEATLENAKIDLKRYQILSQQDSIPKQQLDTQVATVKQVEATVESDQAAVESAKLNLVYCRVTAPITGRVGLRQVDTGNIVHASDTTGIVVINEVQPITVIFTIGADQLPQVLRQLNAGSQLPVDAFDRDNRTKIASGMLTAVDNQIDQTTGTVRLRAQFPNQDLSLFPSQFVNARLLINTLHNATLVPTAALQRSPTATFVYIVQADHSVATRNVNVQLTEGDTTAIRKGLAAGDVVVTDGVDRLRPGMKVAPTEATAAGAPGAPANAAVDGANPAAPPANGAPARTTTTQTTRTTTTASETAAPADGAAAGAAGGKHKGHAGKAPAGGTR